MNKNKKIKKLKKEISLLENRIRIKDGIIAHKDERIAIEEKWGQDANKECIRYAKEIEYKNNLLKNIIS